MIPTLMINQNGLFGKMIGLSILFVRFINQVDRLFSQLYSVLSILFVRFFIQQLATSVLIEGLSILFVRFGFERPIIALPIV